MNRQILKGSNRYCRNKNVIIEMKDIMHMSNNTLNKAEERISKQKDIWRNPECSKRNKEIKYYKREIKKHEKMQWDKGLIGLPKEKQREGTQALFKVIRSENYQEIKELWILRCRKAKAFRVS